MAERNAETAEQAENAVPGIDITFGKGLVRDTFTSKKGNEMSRIVIPGETKGDNRQWESFVLPAGWIHENESGRSVTVRLRANGWISLSRSVDRGRDENGKRIWGREERIVTTRQLKNMLEAYREMDPGEDLGDRPMLMVRCGRGLVSDFTSRTGREMARVMIPNPDPEDKRGWESFVLPAAWVRENESGRSVSFILPEEGSTTLSRSVVTGQDQEGKNLYERQERTIGNRELKSVVEAYMEKDPELEEGPSSEQAGAPESTMTALLVRPGREPETVEIGTDLGSLQEAVHGGIEAISPFEEDVAVICNEEGKLQGLDMNRALRDESGEIRDILCGDFLIAGIEDDDFCSLSPELLEQFAEMFHYPEVFSETQHGIEAFAQPEALLHDTAPARPAAGVRDEGPSL